MIKANTRYFAMKTNNGWMVAGKEPAVKGFMHSADIIAQEKMGNVPSKHPLFRIDVPLPELPNGTEAWVEFYGKTINCACGRDHTTTEMHYHSDGAMSVMKMEIVKPDEMQHIMNNIPKELWHLPLREAIGILLKNRDADMRKSVYDHDFKKFINQRNMMEVPAMINKSWEAGHAADALRYGISQMQNRIKNADTIMSAAKAMSKMMEGKTAPTSKVDPSVEKVVLKAMKKLVALQPGTLQAARFYTALEKTYMRIQKKNS